jgi:hypothetical protein
LRIDLFFFIINRRHLVPFLPRAKPGRRALLIL